MEWCALTVPLHGRMAVVVSLLHQDSLLRPHCMSCAPSNADHRRTPATPRGPAAAWPCWGSSSRRPRCASSRGRSGARCSPGSQLDQKKIIINIVINIIDIKIIIMNIVINIIINMKEEQQNTKTKTKPNTKPKRGALSRRAREPARPPYGLLGASGGLPGPILAPVLDPFWDHV